jgi:hypothetical protein
LGFFVAQACLELEILLTEPQVLELQARTTTPGLGKIFTHGK